MAKAAAKTAQKSNTNPPALATPTAATLAVGADGMIKGFIDDAATKAFVAEKLIVVSSVDGFRRAGRAWSKEATEVLAEDLTAEQVEALMREPKLQVSVVGKEVE